MSTSAACETDPFSVRLERGEGQVCMLVAGEIDLATEQLFREAIAKAVAELHAEPHSALLDAPHDPDQRQRHAALVVDLRAVRFIGAVGIGVLAEQHEALRAQGRSLRVRSASGPVVRLFQITGTSQLLDESASDTVDTLTGLGSLAE